MAGRSRSFRHSAEDRRRGDRTREIDGAARGGCSHCIGSTAFAGAAGVVGSARIADLGGIIFPLAPVVPRRYRQRATPDLPKRAPFRRESAQARIPSFVPVPGAMLTALRKHARCGRRLKTCLSKRKAWRSARLRLLRFRRRRKIAWRVPHFDPRRAIPRMSVRFLGSIARFIRLLVDAEPVRQDFVANRQARK